MPQSAPRKSGRSQRRNEILHRLQPVVERHFAAGEPFTRLSVDTLAEEAGISRTTLYVYFEDKSELLYALAEQAVTELVETTRAWWELDRQGTREDLRAALGRTYEVHLPYRGVMAAAVEVSAIDPGVRAQYEALVASSISEAATFIQHAIDEGFVSEEIDPEPTAAWLCWMIERGDNEISKPGSTLRVDLWLDALTAIIWNTLYRAERS